jgi:hypothetical protein
MFDLASRFYQTRIAAAQLAASVSPGSEIDVFGTSSFAELSTYN